MEATHLCSEGKDGPIPCGGITKAKGGNFPVVIKGLQCLAKNTDHLQILLDLDFMVLV